MDYKTLGKGVQLERLRSGGMITHVNREMFGDKLDQLPYEVPELVTRQKGMRLFNDLAVMYGLKPLREPLGYQALDNNAYQMIQEVFADVYGEAVDNIDQGLMMGSRYALEHGERRLARQVTPVKGGIDRQDGLIRKSLTKYMPEGMHFGDLRFTAVTDELEDVVEEFANQRVRVTQANSIRRSVERSTLEQNFQTLADIGEKFRTVLAPEQLELTFDDPDDLVM